MNKETRWQGVARRTLFVRAGFGGGDGVVDDTTIVTNVSHGGIGANATNQLDLVD